jgi:membrane fusion protein, multidrug efflux system
MNKPKTMKHLILFILSVILPLSCRPKEIPNQPAPVVHVKVTEVGTQKMVFPVRSSGIVAPASEIKLSFKTGGIVNRIYADEGARVKKGTLLATLDMAEIDGQVTQARNGYEKSQRDLERAKNLYKDSVITLEQYQNAQTAYNVARASLDIARFNSLHSKIAAPEDGIILKRLVEAHELVGPGYPVFVYGTSGLHWKISTGLADRDFVRVSTGDSAHISFDVYPGEVFGAIVTQMAEAANPGTGTYQVDLNLEPVSRKLAAGFIAGIEIIPSKTDSYFGIPIESVVDAEGRKGFVFVVSDSGIVKRQEVEISGIFNNEASIIAGLKGGEKIATEGAAYLSDGDQVEIIK